MSSYYLEHHGILGQKWGKRNGPPYPLSEKKAAKVEKLAIKTKDRVKKNIEEHEIRAEYDKNIFQKKIDESAMRNLYRSYRRLSKNEKEYFSELLPVNIRKKFMSGYEFYNEYERASFSNVKYSTAGRIVGTIAMSIAVSIGLTWVLNNTDVWNRGYKTLDNVANIGRDIIDHFRNIRF